jgi:hypothetical protein
VDRSPHIGRRGRADHCDDMQQSTRLTSGVAMKIAIVALLVYAAISTILAAKKRDWLVLAVSAAGILIVTASALAMILQPEH